jgi:hypothetical protein
MATIKTNTNWTPDGVLDPGEYDIQRRGRGRAYLYRGAAGTADLDEAHELMEDGKIHRIHINALEKGYFYGDGVEIVVYPVLTA